MEKEKKTIEVKENNDNSKLFKIILIAIIALVLGVGIYTWGSKEGFGILSKVSKSKESITLKHTNAVGVKSDGVYITDVSDIVDEVMPSIVAITSKTVINSGQFGFSFFGNENYVTEGAGSGVIVAENSNEIFILTNYHVVENTTELSVQFIDDKSYDATVKGVSERKDIAIVVVDKKSLDKDTLSQIRIATMGDSDELKVGNGIIAIGNALGYGQSVTTGVVSALNREVSTDNYTQEMIQIDAAINGGNSGGALLNSKGEVVGINSVKYSSNGYSTSASIEGMGFAIPITNVEELIEKLINGENDTGSLTIGIEGYMTNSSYMAGYNLPEGFYVTAIVSGGNAENSELEIGNIITKIDGNKVTSLEVVRKVLNKKNQGDTVTLTVKYASHNEYKEKEITITLN